MFRKRKIPKLKKNTCGEKHHHLVAKHHMYTGMTKDK